MTHTEEKKTHFIQQRIEADLASQRVNNIITRFPPEPNGFLHIGHAKAICLNFELAKMFNGRCNLRYDDTNPCNEEARFAAAIAEDVRWLGYTWSEERHASDYYEALYNYAIILIQKGLAYVDSSDIESIRSMRGTLQEPGQNSPYRERSIDENMDLFSRMKAGEFLDGTHVLRAKIDMNAGNINLRDPVLYRIRHIAHQRTGDTWCIYPMYDYAHPISDALEDITHSLCTLEFQDHRPLYEWFIKHLPVPQTPVQIEFSRLNVSHTITSKRKLKQLVDEGAVSGWDDPRMPTLIGMRKRGYPPSALRKFCEMSGISKSDSVIDMSVLEACVRDELNQTAKRAFGILDPLKVTIENYPTNQEELLSVPFHPQDPASAQRVMPFTKTLYIDRNDFMDNPPKDFFRLAPGREVRLRHAYIIQCNEVIYNAAGEPIELRCSYDPNTKGKAPEGRKVKGVIHWISLPHAHPIEVLVYDRLFLDENPGARDNILECLNPHSLQRKMGFCEPAIAQMPINSVFQFERVGYYCLNQSINGLATTFHRIVDLSTGIPKSGSQKP